MSDLSVFIIWWLFAGLLGIIFMPVSLCVFKTLKDRGWIFSKSVGIAVSAWLVWFLSSCRIVKFNRTGIILSILICAVFNAGVLYYLKKNKKIDIDRNTVKHMAVLELLFFVMFAFWTYLKCFAPSGSCTTEKLMDFGLMQAINRAEYMPAADMWYAGKPINYYYFGQFTAVFLSKLTGTGTEYGYNLMLMMVAAFSFTMPFSIVSNAFSDLIKVREWGGENTRRFLPAAAGVLSGIAVSFAGNMQYVIYAKLVPVLRSMLGLDKMAESLGYSFPEYWYSNATRYIGYHPETEDKVINEFPVYSFVLGDLHAHVVNIIFVLTVTGILYAFIQQKNSVSGEDDSLNLLKDACSPHLFLTAFFIGIFHISNYWDYPIYFVVTGAVVLFSNIRKRGFIFYTLKLTFIQGIYIIIIAVLLSLPFTMSFEKISNRIRLCESHSPLYQLAVLWLLPVLCVFMLLLTMVMEQKGKRSVKLLITDSEVSDLYMLTIGLCAIGLLIIPELIYVEDIYGGSFKRANTMFKLSYQAFILFGMTMSYAIVRGIYGGKTRGKRVFSLILLLCLLMTSGYFGIAAKNGFGYWTDSGNLKGLNGGEYLKDINIKDYNAANWINQNIEGSPVMLETYGDSYNPDYCRISASTGLPTILGWRTHEWLWRSSGTMEYPEDMKERSIDTDIIYTSNDKDTVRELIKEYNVEYIYVGDTEREKYGDPEKYAYPLNHNMLQSLGTVIYPGNFDTSRSGEDAYIIKITD